jgi:ADP-heptose:LPS heptosyltransferase
VTSAAEKILLIRLKSIGDILFTLPAVHVVRENFPGAKITFLVSQEHALLLEGFREVDEVIPMDRRLFRQRNPARILAGTFALLRRLRQEKFSLVIDFQGYGETAALAWFAGAPARWGIVYQPARGWAYTRGVQRDWQVHAAEWNLWMLEQCGLKTGVVRNEFVLPPEPLAEARRFFAAQGLDAAKPTLFIQPLTSSPHKNWPLEKYLELAHHCRNRGVQILFGGGPAERAALEPARAAGFPVSAGTPLLVSAGLMKLSTVIVGADTGLLHLAVAMGRRVVMIMQAETRNRTNPFRHADWVLAPEAPGLVASIGVDAVVQACEQALGKLDLPAATI